MSTTDPPTVCAIIPTFNRRDLLLEALAGLAAQDRPPDQVVVVDNASTDSTSTAVGQHFPNVKLLTSPINTGSAGGFAAGIRWAFDNGFDWFWLLDNDTVAHPDALSALLAALARFVTDPVPDILASHVVWTDGSLLPMNTPTMKRTDRPALLHAVAARTLSMRYAPYAGLLVSRRAVAEHGLPNESYFLYDDDTEFTGRILAHRFGVLVPESIVVHKVERRMTSQAESGDRFYFAIRNKLWLCRRGEGWSSQERATFVVALVLDITRYLRLERFRLGAWRIMIRGLVHGVLGTPGSPTRVTSAELAGKSTPEGPTGT